MAYEKNRKTLEYSLEIYRLRKISFNNPVAVQQRVIDYFEICARHDQKPGAAGLGLAFGVSRKVIYDIASGAVKKYPDEVAEIIGNALNVINTTLEANLQEGKINPGSGIFMMKNSGAGWSDQQELVVSVNAQQELTPEELAAQAAALQIGGGNENLLQENNGDENGEQ